MDGSDTKISDMIINEPKPLKVVDFSVMASLREYKLINIALRKKYMTVKELHKLYYNTETKSYDRGLKTIYRYVEKLIEEGLVIEVGQRMTQGSRSVEALYGPAAHVFFYGGPAVSEQIESDENKGDIKIQHRMAERLTETKINYQEFEKFVINYQKELDAQSDELLSLIQTDDELLELIRTVPTERLNRLVMNATDLTMLWKKLRTK